MAYVPISRDLTKVKNKVAFNLTPRQLICFGCGGIIGVPLFLVTKDVIGNTTALFALIAVMLPFFFFGIYEKDGVPAEKVLLNIIRAKFFCPAIRVYKTDNLYAYLESEKEVSRGKIKTKKDNNKAKTNRKKRGKQIHSK
jgi:hypothetical protein